MTEDFAECAPKFAHRNSRPTPDAIADDLEFVKLQLLRLGAEVTLT